jgi:hypothetical protein
MVFYPPKTRESALWNDYVSVRKPEAGCTVRWDIHEFNSFRGLQHPEGHNPSWLAQVESYNVLGGKSHRQTGEASAAVRIEHPAL